MANFGKLGILQIVFASTCALFANDEDASLRCLQLPAQSCVKSQINHDTNFDNSINLAIVASRAHLQATPTRAACLAAANLQVSLLGPPKKRRSPSLDAGSALFRSRPERRVSAALCLSPACSAFAPSGAQFALRKISQTCLICSALRRAHLNFPNRVCFVLLCRRFATSARQLLRRRMQRQVRATKRRKLNYAATGPSKQAQFNYNCEFSADNSQPKQQTSTLCARFCLLSLLRL